MEKIFDYFLKNINEYLAPFWYSLFFWRTLSLTLLSLMVIAWLFRKNIIELLNKDKLRDHDREIFRKSEQYFTEEILNEIVATLTQSAFIERETIISLNQYFHYFSMSSNKYLIRRLNKELKNFLKIADDLRDFLGHHFFDSNKEGISRFMLYPELKNKGNVIDYENKKINYDYLAEILSIKVNDVHKNYLKYRHLIKSCLYI